MNIFQKCYQIRLQESSKNLNELFFEAGKCLCKIVDITEKFLHKNIGEVLKESTKFGREYLRQINDIVEEFVSYNKTLQKRIDEYDSNKADNPLYCINKYDLEQIIKMFDNFKSPQILKIMRWVQSEPGYDEEDKKNVYKSCAIYDQLYKEYEHRLHQIKLKQIDLRSIQMKGFSIFQEVL